MNLSLVEQNQIILTPGRNILIAEIFSMPFMESLLTVISSAP
jgi:hypothetical protein